MSSDSADVIAGHTDEDAPAVRRFPSDPGAAQQVRRWVRRGLVAAALDQQCIEIVELLASEVVGNAVLHTDSGEVLVTLSVGPHVQVVVHEDGSGMPASRTAGPLDAGGRGLRLVDALADCWGTHRTGPGKTVWFRVAAVPRPAPSP